MLIHQIRNIADVIPDNAIALVVGRAVANRVYTRQVFVGNRRLLSVPVTQPFSFPISVAACLNAPAIFKDSDHRICIPYCLG